MIERLVVGALVWSNDQQLLLGKRAERLYYGGMWQLPGGGVEHGESLLDAVSRELKEETGLAVSAAEFTLIDGHGQERFERENTSGIRELVDMRFMIFETRLSKRADEVLLEPSDEFDDLNWFSPADLITLQLVPAGVPLFRRLGILR